MLSVKLNGSFVEIADDFSMTMNLKSPIFNETGSSSYPFKIPITPRNSLIMNFWHRIESTVDVYKDIPCEIFWHESMIFIGIFKCRVSVDSYEGSLYEGNGHFNYFQKTISLQQVDFGKISFDNPVDLLAWINDGKDAVYPERSICFPSLYNEYYYDPPATIDELMRFNYYDSTGTMFFSLGFTIENRILIVPMLYFKFFFFKIFEYLKYKLDDQFFTPNSDFDKLVIFNNVSANEWDGGADPQPIPGDNFFKYFIGNLVNYDGPWEFLLNYHVPRMSLNDFITGLETFFNIRFFVNNITRTIRVLSVDSILKANLNVDFNENVISVTTELDEQLRGFHFKTNVDQSDNHLQAKYVIEQSLMDNLQKPVDSLADLPIWPGTLLDEIRYVIQEKSYYYINKYTKIWQKYPSITDIALNTQFIIKEIDKVISSNFSTNSTDTGDFVSIGVKREEWAGIPFHLFFTKRINVQDPDVNGLYAVSRTDDISLLVNGEQGLYNKNYKEYFNFLLSSRAVNILKMFMHHELAEIDFARKYQINGINYLFSTIQVTLKKTSISTAKIKAYTCK